MKHSLNGFYLRHLVRLSALVVFLTNLNFVFSSEIIDGVKWSAVDYKTGLAAAKINTIAANLAAHQVNSLSLQGLLAGNSLHNKIVEMGKGYDLDVFTICPLTEGSCQSESDLRHIILVGEMDKTKKVSNPILANARGLIQSFGRLANKIAVFPRNTSKNKNILSHIKSWLNLGSNNPRILQGSRQNPLARVMKLVKSEHHGQIIAAGSFLTDRNPTKVANPLNYQSDEISPTLMNIIGSNELNLNIEDMLDRAGEDRDGLANMIFSTLIRQSAFKNKSFSFIFADRCIANKLRPALSRLNEASASSNPIFDQEDGRFEHLVVAKGASVYLADKAKKDLACN